MTRTNEIGTRWAAGNCGSDQNSEKRNITADVPFTLLAKLSLGNTIFGIIYKQLV